MELHELTTEIIISNGERLRRLPCHYNHEGCWSYDFERVDGGYNISMGQLQHSPWEIEK